MCERSDWGYMDVCDFTLIISYVCTFILQVFYNFLESTVFLENKKEWYSFQKQEASLPIINASLSEVSRDIT
jgi:hypothetical protein